MIEDDLPLSAIQDFVTEFQNPENKGRSGVGNKVLFQAKVVSYDATLKRLMISYDGATIGVPFFMQRNYIAGEVVWGIKDGHIKLVIGKLNNAAGLGGGLGMLAWAKVALSTGGAANGYLGGGYGAGALTKTLTTVSQGLDLGVANVPVLPNRLMRVKFKFAAQGTVNTAQETYYQLNCSWNGAGYYVEEEFRASPSGINAPSPMGEFLFVSPSNAATLSCGLLGALSTGTSTLYRYTTGVEAFRSHFQLEDLGSAV